MIAALSADRYKVQLTIGGETYAKLRKAQDLLRHVAPDGDLESLFDRAIALLLADLERKRMAAATRPRSLSPAHVSTSAADRRGTVGGPRRGAAGDHCPASRHIPAAVRRTVWARDGGRCAFVGTAGRCSETGLLQFHHLEPFAAGGQAIAQNIELRCARHNMLEAELFFGTRAGLHCGGAHGRGARSRGTHAHDARSHDPPGRSVRPARHSYSRGR